MKSKITKFDVKEPFQGTTSAFVTLEDETWGFFEYKGEAPFKEGDEVEYTAVKEKTKKGKDIVKLIIKKLVSETPQKEVLTETKPPKGKFPLSESEIVNRKIDGIFTSIQEAMKAWTSNTITYDKLTEIGKTVRDYIWEGIDELKNQE